MELQALSINYEALHEKAKHPTLGVSLHDREYLFTTYERTFTGKEVVDWVCTNVQGGVSREQASALCKRLIYLGIMKHVTGRENFSDTSQLYQFTNNQPVCPDVKGTCTKGSDKGSLTFEELFDLHQQLYHDPLFLPKKTGLLRIVKRAAKSNEIVDWMVAKYGVTRVKARQIGNELLRHHYLQTCCHMKEFQDDAKYWFSAADLGYLHKVHKAEEDKPHHLSLAKCHVPALFPKLQDLRFLKSLDLSHNDIEYVCFNVSLLPNLEELSFAKNRIVHVVPEIGRLTHLKKLDLSDNLLDDLPDAIGGLHNLGVLIVDNNKLKTIPSQLGKLSSLQHLSLCNNFLSDIPDSTIAKMTNLRKLHLGGNLEIRSIPVNLVNLTKLQELCLEETNIESLPIYLANFPSLTLLGLKNNQNIKCPPKSVAELGSSAILSYLRDMNEATVPCYTGKLMFLGMENMGKTSLFAALGKNSKFWKPTFSKRPKPIQTLSTDGIDIGALKLDTCVKNSSDSGIVVTQRRHFRKRVVESLTLSCWDFAGQEVYYTTHEFFLTDNSLYIVVWDIKRPPEQCKVDFWLKSINSRAPNAPVLLVATHTDEVDSKVVAQRIAKVEEEYTSNYPQIVHVDAVSTCTGSGIRSFRKSLRAIAMQQPFINQRIPGKYYALAQAVLNHSKTKIPPVVSWREYKEIAELISIVDDKLLVRATRTLHDLGSLLHYTDESLKDLVFLAPQWLSNCFSSIVSVKNSFCKDGRLNLKNLTHIWRNEVFPQHLHASLLRVLERFEIIYIPRTNAKQQSANSKSDDVIAIVPALLPIAKPKTLQALWSQAKSGFSLGRKFEFSFITKAFFGRLLVRLLHCGDPVEYWRYGILSRLNHRSVTSALVQFDDNTHVLSVEIKGQDFRSCAEFLTEVLENVHTVVSDWPKVRSQVLVPCVCSQVCVKNPYMFPLADIENAILESEQAYISCPTTGRMVCIDHLAPDISMATLKVNKINPDELAGLDLIGEGSFAQVFKAYYRGELVAVKQLVFEEETESQPLTSSSMTSSLTSEVSGSGSANSLTVSFDSAMSSPTSSKSWTSSKVPSHTRQNSEPSLATSSPVLLNPQLSNPVQKVGNHRRMVSEATLANMTEFRREVWLMTSLLHPNIVSMKGFCFDPYSIVMEYMDLGSLSAYLRQNYEKTGGAGLPFKTQLKLALDVAKGMQFLHSTSPPLVHRDLKSPNVLLKTSDDEPYVTCKVSDFGLSRTSVSGFVSKVIDNPLWLAPEILKKKAYDEKADVYSFAIILWEINTCQFPFDEFKIKFTYVLEDKICEGLRPTIPASTPLSFASLMQKCWDSTPSERPSFHEIVKQLEDIRASHT